MAVIYRLLMTQWPSLKCKNIIYNFRLKTTVQKLTRFEDSIFDKSQNNSALIYKTFQSTLGNIKNYIDHLKLRFVLC